MRILVNCMKKTVSMEIVNYADIPIPQFVDIILKGDDEAMYYLLHERLKHLLFERYQDYSHNLYDDFDDLLDDFFIYNRKFVGRWRDQDSYCLPTDSLCVAGVLSERTFYISPITPHHSQ